VDSGQWTVVNCQLSIVHSLNPTLKQSTKNGGRIKPDLRENCQLSIVNCPLLNTFPIEQQMSIVNDIEKQLYPILYKNGIWFADYKRIRVIAIKN